MSGFATAFYQTNRYGARNGWEASETQRETRSTQPTHCRSPKSVITSFFRSNVLLVPTFHVGMHTRTLRVRVPPMHGRNKNGSLRIYGKRHVDGNQTILVWHVSASKRRHIRDMGPELEALVTFSAAHKSAMNHGTRGWLRKRSGPTSESPSLGTAGRLLWMADVGASLFSDILHPKPTTLRASLPSCYFLLSSFFANGRQASRKPMPRMRRPGRCPSR